MQSHESPSCSAQIDFSVRGGRWKIEPIKIAPFHCHIATEYAQGL
jgi:hypothetical protein